MRLVSSTISNECDRLWALIGDALKAQWRRRKGAACSAFAAMLLLSSPIVADAQTLFAAPVDCAAGRDCFLQQTPDFDAGPGAADSFCGTATYDGHDGVDIRILSLTDIERGHGVLAMAGGTVKGVRDGVADRLVRTQAEVRALAGRECGNGVVIDHGGGLETQYCHMRQGSVTVRNGDAVNAGEKIGEIGSSGFAQFAHVHVSVRVNGRKADALTGKFLDTTCDDTAEAGTARLDPKFAAALGTGDAIVLAMGVANQPLEHARLASEGAPLPATSGGAALVGWAWFANLRAGDRIDLVVTGPDGWAEARQVTQPLDRNKADYSLFAGRKGKPPAGTYRIAVEIIRDGKTIRSQSGEYEVR